MASQNFEALSLDEKENINALFELEKLSNRSRKEFSKYTEQFKGETFRVSDTPETLLPSFGENYDITIFCHHCSLYIDVSNLHNHRAYHKALDILQLNPSDEPLDSQTLLDKRHSVIKQIKEDATENKQPLDISLLKIIDDAYEILKNDSFSDVYKPDPSKFDSEIQSYSFKCSVKCVSSVGIATSRNSRWKNEMEDAKVYQDHFGEDIDKCYVAVFDGYHGSNAAIKCSKHLHEFLLKEIQKFDSKIVSTVARNFAEFEYPQEDYELQRPDTRNSVTRNLYQESKVLVQNILDTCCNEYDSQMETTMTKSDEKKKKKTDLYSDCMKKAFKKAYLSMDDQLSYGIDELSRIRWSGTSAVTCLIQQSSNQELSDSQIQGHIHLANVGQAKALLVKDNKFVCITKNHSPESPSERNRIYRQGGSITKLDKGSLVNGILSVTRGLGNFGDKLLKDCVIAEPYFRSVSIDQNTQYLVLASSGVWQSLKNEEVASLLTRMLPNQQIPPPSRLSESLLPLLTPRITSEQKIQSTDNVLNFKTNHNDKSTFHQENGAEYIPDVEHCIDTEVDTVAETVDSEVDTVAETVDTEVYTGAESVDTEVDTVVETVNNEGNSTLDSDNDESKNVTLAKAMAEQLTYAALLAGATENVTVMVILLPGCRWMS
ncbi:protein phosphatase 2C-like domain-containing protein 1 [Biomphalaria pfeifferi]|uniref:Protein phosphatase 2C-like domain-containing protein 1 n=1 Tax=Biomphalaria pfeifferi TaxID=112525 RepID=A0AAD8C782_BIOPF|nr:protein phosphatase 2C-like domain-containing protein 1 [Biomphalaria pfeifferi]